MGLALNSTKQGEVQLSGCLPVVSSEVAGNKFAFMTVYLAEELCFACLDCLLVCVLPCARIPSADAGQLRLESNLIKCTIRACFVAGYSCQSRALKRHFELQFPSFYNNPEELQESGLSVCLQGPEAT